MGLRCEKRVRDTKTGVMYQIAMEMNSVAVKMSSVFSFGKQMGLRNEKRCGVLW